MTKLDWSKAKIRSRDFERIETKLDKKKWKPKRRYKLPRRNTSLESLFRSAIIRTNGVDPKWNAFILSLQKQYKETGRLSEKQEFWLKKIAARPLRISAKKKAALTSNPPVKPLEQPIVVMPKPVVILRKAAEA